MPDTATHSTAVDLSRLPAPTIVEQLSFEAILAELRTHLVELFPDFVATVESDPLNKLLRIWSYRELLLRQTFNERAKQIMVAYATKSNLDHLAALVGVARLELDPGNPGAGVDPVDESDDALRQRIVLAAESFSVAGPELAYVFHAKSADGDVLDASATAPRPDDIKQLVADVLAGNGASPELTAAMTAALNAAVWPGAVLISVLSRTGDGTAPAETLAAVEAVVNSRSIRPLGDHVSVASAEIVEFAVVATLYTNSGPDAGLVMAAAEARLLLYIAENRRLGRDPTTSGIIAALMVPGVQRVTLSTPAADVACDATQAAYCTGIALTHGGYAE